jgi:hypothetical protein
MQEVIHQDDQGQHDHVDKNRRPFGLGRLSRKGEFRVHALQGCGAFGDIGERGKFFEVLLVRASREL